MFIYLTETEPNEPQCWKLQTENKKREKKKQEECKELKCFVNFFLLPTRIENLGGVSFEFPLKLNRPCNKVTCQVFHFKGTLFENQD